MGANFIEIPIGRVEVRSKSTNQLFASLIPECVGPYVEETMYADGDAVFRLITPTTFENIDLEANQMLYNKFIEMFEFRGSIVKKEVA